MITITAPQGSYFFADFAVLISGMSKHIEETSLTVSQLKYLISSAEHKRVLINNEDMLLIKNTYSIKKGGSELPVQEAEVVIAKEDKENKVTEIQNASHTEYPTTSAVVDYVDKVVSSYLVKADLEAYATKQEVFLRALGIDPTYLKDIKVVRSPLIKSEENQQPLNVHLNNLYQKIENLTGVEQSLSKVGSSFENLQEKFESLKDLVGLKIFRKKVYTKEVGVWEVDYSEISFSEEPLVVATAIAVGAGTADKRFASLQKDSVTNSGCKGYLHSSSSAGLLAAMTMVPGEGFVNVIAIGK